MAEFEATFGAKGEDAESKPQVKKAVGKAHAVQATRILGAAVSIDF